MSEKTEKLVNIILPDLLNYLDMVESGEIIEKRLEKNIFYNGKKNNKIQSDTTQKKINLHFFQKKLE